MTTIASERTILSQLSKVHARRFARHPLFLVGFLACMGFILADILVDGSGIGKDRDFANTIFFPGFFIGVFAIIVAYRLTRTEERALALIPTAPTTPTVRTLALCRACVVPMLAAAIAVAVTVIGWKVRQPSLLPAWQNAMSAADFWAWIIGCSIIAGLGGGLLGVAVGRWWGFPGAGVVAAAIMVLAVFFATNYAGAPGDNDLATMIERSNQLFARFVAAIVPFTNWLLAEYDLEDPMGPPILPYVMRVGSAVGHLVYMLGLSGLAVWAAVMKDAEGPDRTRWHRNGLIAAGVALVGLVWTIVG